MPTKIEISHRTIIFTIFTLLALWFLIQIREIIFLVFISFIFMSALRPMADKLEKFHIPRALSALIVYVIGIIFVVFAANAIIPPLVTQSIRLGENLPGYIHNFIPFVTIDVQTLTSQITPLGENLIKVTVGLFSNIIALFTLFVISFYLLLERKNLESHLSIFMGKEAAALTMTTLVKVEDRLGAWVRGQLLLAVTIGVATFFGLTLLGIPYTFPLAIIAGILEIVPIIGPIISAIPAILVAITISPLLAMATAALYFIIQQAEAHAIVPMVMRKAVGVPPLVTIIALLIGAKIAGIGGALLSVPIFVTIETVIAEYFRLRSHQSK